MSEKIISFVHGFIGDDYEKQANEQGFTLGDYKKLFVRVKKGLTVLRMRGYFTDTQYKSVLKKVQKDLVKNLKPLTEGKRNESD